MSAKDHLEITFTSSTYSQGKVRDFIANAISSTAQLDEQQRHRIYAVVDELCNNALEHGSSEGDEVRVRVRVDSKKVEIMIEDRGNGENPKTAKQITEIMKDRQKMAPHENKTKRGRGLPLIVAKWVDKVEFSDLSDGGIRALVIKYL